MNKEQQVTLYQDNILTQSKNNFNAVEKNCIYLIIEEVQKKYITSNSGQRNLFDDLIIQFNGSQLGKAISNKSPEYAFKSLIKLRQRYHTIINDEIWLAVGYINYVKKDPKTNLYEVQVSKEILPYLIELTENNQFTSYQLTVALSLRSQYSKRFYEFCNQYKNQKMANGMRWFFLTIDKIKDLFMINKKRSTYDIKRDVIEVPLKELQQAYEKGESDLYFTYDVRDKQGKKELSYNFYIHAKEDEERKALNYTTLPGILAQVDSMLTSFIKRNPKYIKRVKMAIQLNPDIAQPLLEKLVKIMENYDKKQIAPVIYYALKEDFNIQSKN